MASQLLSWCRKEAKRVVAIILALALPSLAFDAAIGHFAGKSNDHWGQWVPIYFAPPATLLLLIVSLPAVALPKFRWVMKIGGVLTAAVGIAGTYFHLLATLREIGQDAWTLPTLEGALSVAPPLLAPGAFIGIGAVLWMLGHPRLVLMLRGADSLEPGASADAAPASNRSAA